MRIHSTKDCSVMNRLSLFVLGVFFAVSCSENVARKSSIAETKSFVNDLGTWESKSVTHYSGEMSYSATQLPVSYYVKNNNLDFTDSQIDSIGGTMRKERIIEFRFQHIKGEDLLASHHTHKGYKPSVEYMAFKIKEDFYLKTKNTSRVRCIGVHFERNFKIAPFKKILLYFDNVPEGEDIQLIYKDRLFRNGIFKFNLNHKPIKL